MKPNQHFPCGAAGAHVRNTTREPRHTSPRPVGNYRNGSMTSQGELFSTPQTRTRKGRKYKPVLTAVENNKGVLDVDTVKGCTHGMRAYPGSGCYGECYAYKDAKRYGIDFSRSVSRLVPWRGLGSLLHFVASHWASWYRVGTAGDPSHDWEHTVRVCELLRITGKVPVIITKHWLTLDAQQIARLEALHAVVNTSTSGLDTDAETSHRVSQLLRLKLNGIKSVCRVVTCRFGKSEWAMECKRRQEYLLSLVPVVDNPLRASASHPRVKSGEIIIYKDDSAIGGGKFVSTHKRGIYMGACDQCPDQCGVSLTT